MHFKAPPRHAKHPAHTIPTGAPRKPNTTRIRTYDSPTALFFAPYALRPTETALETALDTTETAFLKIF